MYMSPQFDDLISKGRIRGFISFLELNQLFPEDTVNLDKLDEIISHLDQLGIEVRDQPAESTGS